MYEYINLHFFIIVLGIINIFSDEKGESMDVCTSTNSPSIVNNNHVNKKNQSKLRGKC